MLQQFNITAQGVTVICQVSCKFSNLLRLEYFDESKTLFKTGYQNVNLGLSLDPFGRMQTIALDVAECFEKFTKCKPESIQSGTISYTDADMEQQRKWRWFLSDESIQEINPQFKQLTLF